LTDLDTRLTRCFAGAFPDLRETQIPSATVDNTASWDSMGALTLTALVEEEFGVAFGDNVIGSLRSYPAVRAELARSIPDAAAPVSDR